MKRIHTSFDWFDAHIIVMRLREEGINAHIFDSNFVNLDWFKMLVFRGFRIVVPAESALTAVEIIQKYRSGDLRLDDGENEERCSQCMSSNITDDPHPRRLTFIGIFMFDLIASLFIISVGRPSSFDLATLFIAMIVFFFAIPPIAVNFFKWRYRCAACSHRWKEPPRHSYAELMALAKAADSTLLD